jgi:hypothetical protein
VQFENLVHTKGLKGVAVKSKDLKTLGCIDPDTECVRDFLVKGDCNGKCGRNRSHRRLQQRTRHLTSRPLFQEICFASNMVKKKPIVFIYFSLPTNAGAQSLAVYEQLYKRVVNLYELKLRAAGAFASLPLRPVDSVDITRCETLQAARAVVNVEVRDVTLGAARDEMTVTIPPPLSSSAASSVARQERHSTTSFQHPQPPSTGRSAGAAIPGAPPSSPVVTPVAQLQSPTPQRVTSTTTGGVSVTKRVMELPRRRQDISRT